MVLGVWVQTSKGIWASLTARMHRDGRGRAISMAGATSRALGRSPAFKWIKLSASKPR